MEDLTALRVRLQHEEAARHELELQSTSVTRQLWLLRDKYDRELRQLQDQLSIVRASLILAHKQQQLEKRRPSGAPEQPLLVAVEDVTFTEDDLLDSPKKQWQIPDQRSRLTPAGLSRESTPQDKVSAHTQQQPIPSQNETVTAPTNPDAAVLLLIPSTAQSADRQSPLLAGPADASPSVAAQDPDHNNSAASCVTATATQLLTAAARLQQLVEQLTDKEPAAAAELSVLQWQLTAAYASLTGTSRRSSSRNICDEYASPAVSKTTAAAAAEQVAASEAEAASPDHAAQQQQAAATQLPTAASVREATMVRTNSDPLTTAAHSVPGMDSASGAEQQDIADMAAAARLFSGAATTLQSSQLHWYYKDGSSIRGPHEPSLMIRWHCSCFLEGSLPVAGVLQQADGSSRPPPDSAFQPLKTLLQQVQQPGCLYTPHGVLQDHTEAHQLLPVHHKHTAAVTAAAEEVVRGQRYPSLPVSIISRSPVGNPSVADVSNCRISTMQSLSTGGAGQLLSNLVAAFGHEVDGCVDSASAKQLRDWRPKQQHTAQQQPQPNHKQLAAMQAGSSTEPAVEGWSIAAVSRAAYAAIDALEGMGNAVESAVTATVESVISTAESAFAGQLGAAGIATASNPQHGV